LASKRCYILGLITSLICFASLLQVRALADDLDQFTGSDYKGTEFKATSFKDKSLDKEDFAETLSKSGHGAKKIELEVDKAEHEKRRDNGIAPGEGEEAGDVVGERRSFLKQEKLEPVHELPGDWVPGKIDLTSNGGFALGPFNGTPVPYELNGHVDLERGKP
jgi:hypothetical protein